MFKWNKKIIGLIALLTILAVLVGVVIYVSVTQSHSSKTSNTPCLPGTWSKTGTQPGCTPCLSCENGKEIKPCTKTSPTKCGSKSDPDPNPDHDHDSDSDSDSDHDHCGKNHYKDATGCHECTKCTDDQVKVRECTKKQDTKCKNKVVNCKQDCGENEICDTTNGSCVKVKYNCNLGGGCVKTANGAYSSLKDCNQNCHQVKMSADCDSVKGKPLKPWSNHPKKDEPEKYQHWLSNVIDPQAIWVPESNSIGGIKDGGPQGGKTAANIKALCPYGMYFDTDKTLEDIKNTNPGNIFDSDGKPTNNSPCKDYKPNDDCTDFMLNQCLSDKQTVDPPTPLPNIYMTWFELPIYISEDSAISYINLLLKFCKLTHTSNTKKSKGIKGLCFPMVTWPDKSNMSWLYDAKDSAETTRSKIGKWVCKNFLEPCENNNIAGGLLLYTNFKDGPWATGFYKEEAEGKGNKNLINPITGKPFSEYKCSSGSKDDTIDGCTKFVWGAFIHFVNNYIIPNYKNKDWLGKNLWFHLDKEGCNCGHPHDYIKYMETYIGKGANLPKPTIGTRMLLATAIGTAGEGAGALTDDKTAGTYNSISVPENYWSAGNQLPCGGDEGSYLHPMSGCTNLNTHRRLADKPVAYQNLITAQGSDTEARGSDCAEGWLGNGKWAAEMDTLKPKKAKREGHDADAWNIYGPKWVWPSFSIENLSLCDKNDPACYSQYMQEKNSILRNTGKDPDPFGKGLRYTGKLTENTTLCLNMLYGNNPNESPTQGTRACGVFDGFSYWSWSSMIDYLNLFCKQSGAQNVIVYEASFIPYHWLVEVGALKPGKKPANQAFQLLPAPVINVPCKKNEDCLNQTKFKTDEEKEAAKNILCLDPHLKQVENGKSGFCTNVCVEQPAGLGKIDLKDRTIWAPNDSLEKAEEACVKYFSKVGETITGISDEGNSIKYDKSPFKHSCIGKNWPSGSVTVKATADGKHYTCKYKVNKPDTSSSKPTSCSVIDGTVKELNGCPKTFQDLEKKQIRCKTNEDCDNYFKVNNCSSDKFRTFCALEKCMCQFKEQKPETPLVCDETWKVPEPLNCNLKVANIKCTCHDNCQQVVKKCGQEDKGFYGYCKENGKTCSFHNK